MVNELCFVALVMGWLRAWGIEAEVQWQGDWGSEAPPPGEVGGEVLPALRGEAVPGALGEEGVPGEGGTVTPDR